MFRSNDSPGAYNQQTRVAEVFTPSAPVDSMALFRGRAMQIQMLVEAASQIGQHAIVYGERGVGKTSIANVLYEVLGRSVILNLMFAHVNCDVEDTFDSLWRKIFRELSVTDSGRVTDAQYKSLDMPRTLAEWLGNEISPDDIRRLSSLVDARLIVIIDEFDQLAGNSETVRLIANTIKTLSDRRASVTLILVGVADNITQLIAEHESVERNLIQVHMPRMSDPEISQIVSEGLSSLQMTIDAPDLAYICSLAQGLPAAAHRIGFQLASHMLGAGRSQVTREDVLAALEAAIDRMPQSHSRHWQEATESSTDDSLFEKVLIAAALAPRDRLGWFQVGAVRDPFRVLTGNPAYGMNAYSQHLHRFATRRGVVMDRAKSEGRWQFRFRNPSFQSYVIMRGLSSGAITEDVLAGFRENLPADARFA